MIVRSSERIGKRKTENRKERGKTIIICERENLFSHCERTCQNEMHGREHKNDKN